MTPNDILFLDSVKRVQEANDTSKRPLVIETPKQLLSDELLKLISPERDSQGGWFMGVYIVFVPLFRQVDAKDWQTNPN